MRSFLLSICAIAMLAMPALGQSHPVQKLDVGQTVAIEIDPAQEPTLIQWASINGVADLKVDVTNPKHPVLVLTGLKPGTNILDVQLPKGIGHVWIEVTAPTKVDPTTPGGDPAGTPVGLNPHRVKMRPAPKWAGAAPAPAPVVAPLPDPTPPDPAPVTPAPVAPPAVTPPKMEAAADGTAELRRLIVNQPPMVQTAGERRIQEALDASRPIGAAPAAKPVAKNVRTPSPFVPRPLLASPAATAPTPAPPELSQGLGIGKAIAARPAASKNSSGTATLATASTPIYAPAIGLNGGTVQAGSSCTTASG